MDRIIILKPGEGKPFTVLFFYCFCVVALTIAGKAARDTYFLSRYDKSLLPVMFGVGAAAVALAVAAYSGLARWLGARTALHLANGLFAVSLLLLQSRISGLLIPVTYVWVEVITVVSLLQFWLLAPAIFDPRSAKRLYGPIAGGGSVGAIVMGLSLKPLVHLVGSGNLLYVVVALLLASWKLALVASQFVTESPTEKKPVNQSSAKEPFNDYLVCIAVAISMAAIVTTIVDYQFKILAGRTYPTEAGLVGFFGTFYAATGAASLLAQFSLTGFVLSRFGILAGLLVLPVLHNAGVLMMLLNPALASAVIAKFSDQTFKFTLTNSSMELLWLPVPARRRLALKPLVSGTLKSMSEGGAGIIMYLLAPLVALQHLSFVVLGALLVWVATLLRLRGLYVREVAQAVESGRINFGELRVDMQDRVMVSTIERTLLGESEPQILFALHLIDGLSLHPWKEPLRRLLDQGSLPVRKRILALAGDVLPEEALTAAIGVGDDASADALIAAGRRNLPILPLLRDMLASPNAELRAAAAAAMKRAGPEAEREADAVLTAMLSSGDTESVAAAIRCLARDPELLPTAQLIAHIDADDRVVRTAALEALGERADITAILPIIRSVDANSDASRARRLLRSFAPELVVPILISEFDRNRGDRKRASLLARVLADYPGEEPRKWLLGAIDSRDLDLCEAAAEGLLRSVRAAPPSGQFMSGPLAGKIAELGERAYYFTRVLALLPAGDSAFLLRDYYDNQVNRALTVILRLSAIRNPSLPIETCIRIVRVREPRRLPFVLELLDGLLTQQERRVIYPLIESKSIDERDLAGGTHFASLPASLEPVLTESIHHGQSWIATISGDYKSRQHGNGTKKFAEVKPNMYTTLEKAVFLKSVSLFQNIPAERIADIAQVAVETRFPANAVLFREGDHGDSLYIVLSGCVLVHKAGRTLATLTQGACVGEMAVLDQEPRSADATAVEDSTLLRIDQEAFYEVLSQSPELMHGIIRLLTARLRSAGERLATSFTKEI